MQPGRRSIVSLQSVELPDIKQWDFEVYPRHDQCSLVILMAGQTVKARTAKLQA